MPVRRKVVESDLQGFGYGHIEYCEEFGDHSTLTITFNDNMSNHVRQTMEIVGSSEIEEFFKLIDRVRAEETAAVEEEQRLINVFSSEGG
jgi:hypothetical protein